MSRLGDLRGLRGLGGLGGLRRLRLGGRLGDRELWRRSVARWLPALAGLALALLLFAVYLGRFAGRVEVGEEALDGGRQQLAALLAERRRIESELARVGDNRTRLAQFYDQRLSTESRRLTRIIAEVKELARRSGLEPQAISYPDETIEDFGLRKRSFVFGVEGTYADLRKLINLLELSDSFLTLERVDLSGEGQRGGGRLRIDLGLSTLFATGEPAAPEPAAGAPAAAAPPEPITPGAPPAEAGSEVEG